MKQLLENLKKQHFSILFAVIILSLVAFLLSLIGIILYGVNCASEFNGNKVSGNVMGWGITGVIFAGLAFAIDVVAFFLAKSSKAAYVFSFVRFFNYATFICVFAAFCYLFLDEYSLLGTILYPIVSGTVGDPVDPFLSGCYFSAIIMTFVALIVALVAGIMLRKNSHKILDDSFKAGEAQVSEAK